MRFGRVLRTFPDTMKSWLLKSARAPKKVKNHYFSIKYHELEKKVVPLQSHLPMTAMMSTEVYGAVGWRHYIIEGVTDALFLVILKLPLSESRSRTMQG